MRDNIRLFETVQEQQGLGLNTQQKNITGTQVGQKFAQDNYLLGAANPIPVDSTIDLTDKIANFKLYDVDNFETINDITYVMYSDLAGKWFVKKVDQTTGEIRYASVVNNSTIVFNTAWSNRSTLVYGYRKDIVSGL